MVKADSSHLRVSKSTLVMGRHLLVLLSSIPVSTYSISKFVTRAMLHNKCAEQCFFHVVGRKSYDQGGTRQRLPWIGGILLLCYYLHNDLT